MPPNATFITRLLGTLFALTLAASCAAPQSPRSHIERATAEAQSELLQALDGGFEGIEQLAPYRLQARYNPPHGGCLCPVFEIQYFGRWNRVFLDPQDDALQATLDDYTRTAARRSRRPDLVFVGQPSNTSQRCDSSGQRFPVFALDAIEPMAPMTP